MPVDILPAVSTAASLAEGGEIEGGREGWEQETDRVRRRSGRSKRKTRAMEQSVQSAQQYEVMDGAAPANQQQFQDTPKRQHLDGHTVELLPPETQSNGFGEVSGDSEGTAEHPRLGDQPQDGYHPTRDDLDPHLLLPGGVEGDEDLVSLIQRQQTEATELLAKCAEALSEGIEYEAFFPVRIDEMLRATHSLEQSLLEQKQAMKDRLQEILGLL